MKKILRSVLFLFCFCFSACASAPAADPTPPSLVTDIFISYHYGDMHLKRHFTDIQKIDIVLHYLYDLSPYGTPEEDPEQIWGDCCRITLTMSDGTHHIYRQQGGRYLSVDNRPWQKINENQSAALFPLLMRIQSD